VIPHLYQRDFTDMEFNLFSLNTQKKCSSILNAIEEKINVNRKINKNLLTISNKLYEEWFLNFEFPNGFNEPYKTNNGEFKDTDLGAIPLDWEIGTLKDLIDFKNGYSFKSGDLLKNECSECYAIFKMGNIIKGGGFNPSATKSWIKKSEAPNLDKYLIKKGDLLMCMTDMKGNVALLGHTALMDVDNEYLLNQRVGLLRVSNDIGINYPYLYLLTNHHIFLTNLRGRANSGVQVNLSTKEIKDSKIIIPSKNINQKFNNIVKPIFDIIFTNNIEIQKLTKLRDTLLPKLMSGEIDVSKINCDLE
ncbi:MAG: restriction endonuclease subunit S, partial [Methanobrevibacter sp.]|nr:restriction endonuclease subunit S [Methanobrevibacter sp.]